MLWPVLIAAFGRFLDSFLTIKNHRKRAVYLLIDFVVNQ